MDVMSLTARLGLDSSAYEKGLNKASGGLKNLAGTFKKVAAGLAIGGAVVKSVQTVVNLTKQAVREYGEYEQLVGGINKLFGQDAEAMKKYADSVFEFGQRGEDVKELQEELIKLGYDLGNAGADGIFGPKTQAAFEAYKKTAAELGDSVAANKKVIENAWSADELGMSVNEYMSSVTGFSAALIKSLGGDANKAADIADMAMRDIADNANTYGKYTVEELTGVYQALARGNFQTLDNLQLGYAGTKEGMKQLIADANRLKVANGEMADLSIDSYADMIEAIHLVQDNMGITGTTANEAAGTIQGSLNATKAAWKNLLVAFGSGKDVKKAMSKFTANAKNVIKNVVPIVKNALAGISEFVGEIGPVLIAELPGLITELLPGTISAVGNLIKAVGRAIPGMFSALGTVFGSVLDSISGWLNENAPELGKAFDTIRSSAETAFEKIGEYWETTLKPTLETIWTYVNNNIIPPIVAAFKTFSAAISEAFDTISQYWTSTLYPTFYAIWSYVKNTLAPGIVEAWPSIKDAIGGAMDTIATVWTNTLRPALASFWAWLTTLLGPALNLISGALSGDSEAIEELKNTFNKILPVLAGIVAGFIAFKTAIAISDTITAVSGAVTGLRTGLSFLWNVISAHPIATIVTVLASLAAAFITAYQTNDEFRAKVNSAWNAVKRVGETVWSAIQQAIEAVKNALTLFWKKVTDAKEAIATAWNALKTNAENVWGNIQGAIDTVKTAIGNFLTKAEQVRDAIGGVFESIKQAVTEPINSIIGAVQGAINKIKELLGLSGQAANINPSKWGVNASGGGGGTRGGGAGRYSGYAKGMSGGYILNGATVFGMRNGIPLVGGEAGPEAVVGVHSLNDMIQSSVNAAMAQSIGRLEKAILNQKLQVVLDTGALVGGIATEMDGALSDIATWRGGGRA